MNSLGRLHRVVVLAVVGCALPWAGQMLGGGQVFGQRSGDSQLDAKRLSRNRVSEAPRGLKPAAQDIQDIMGIDFTAADRSADRSAAARAVTGPTEHLSEIIAGEVPATLIYALTPVAEHPGGAYGGGNLSYSSADISGQELTVHAGTTTYWNVQLSNWAPTGLRLRAFQAKVLAETYASGDGAPLELSSIPCGTNADCVDAHGEPRTRCSGDGICSYAWINKTRTDGLLFDQIETDCISAWDLGISPTGPLFFADTNPNPSKTEFCSEADKGIIYYLGTLALAVPLGAVGTYTIEFANSETFALDDTLSPFPIEIPIGTLASGVLHVLPPADPWTPGTCTVEPSDVTNLDQATITLGGDWGLTAYRTFRRLRSMAILFTSTLCSTTPKGLPAPP
ncbi:MAG: hypothetical protein IID35_03325 [Planctomycetes bacterium]|nr:hypothetical protein [Planctomycetota bacterium]